MFEQIAPTTFAPALRDAVLPGAFVRRLNPINLHRSDRNWAFQPVLRVAIKEDFGGLGSPEPSTFWRRTGQFEFLFVTQ